MLLLAFWACSGDDETPTDPTDPIPAISIADRTVIEGNTLLFSVTLDQTTSHAVVYSFATTDITATAPGDYYAASATDTIAAGETDATILVISVDDTDIETTETFSVSLTSTTGATVARSLAIGTITDNDPTGVSFASQVQPLLRTSCGKLGTCHGGAFPGGDLYIGTTAVYDTVISATGSSLTGGGLVVVPGNSAASTLYTQTTDNYNQAFSRMPKANPALSLEQQNLIRDWIDQGALDN